MGIAGFRKELLFSHLSPYSSASDFCCYILWRSEMAFNRPVLLHFRRSCADHFSMIRYLHGGCALNPGLNWIVTIFPKMNTFQRTWHCFHYARELTRWQSERFFLIF